MDNLTILKNILLDENVNQSIIHNLDVLTTIIPEINSIIGFDHKHPHHHLDVFNHTLLALSMSPKDFTIRFTLLLHDIGKPFSYTDGEVRHYTGHALVSSNIAKEILKRFDLDPAMVNEILYLITKHDTLISQKEINENLTLAHKRFQVQYCDALAHHPLMLEKRIRYLLKISESLPNTNSYQQSLKQLLKETKKSRK